METKAFRPPARVMIVAGKGGVGKTTVSAALAYVSALHGLRTLVVEVDGKSGLTSLFGQPSALGYSESVLLPAGAAGAGSAELRARVLTPDDALIEYLEDRGMKRISRRLSQTGTLDVIATAVPGIKEILVLGKVKQIELRMGAGDPSAPECIVVDAPAAGHAVTFLSSAYGLLEAAAVGPIRAQASDVVEMLSDPSRCQVLLVTLPEETPVNEAVDTAFHLEDRAAVKLAPIVVNGLWAGAGRGGGFGSGVGSGGGAGAGSPGEVRPGAPPEGDPGAPAEVLAAAGLSAEEAASVIAAARFRRDREQQQASQLARLAEMLPLDQLRLPFLFRTELGLADVELLAAALAAQVEKLW